MHVYELGFQTELIFHNALAKVDDRGDHLFINTSSNPTYHWGNLLYFSRPPQREDTEKWIALFKESFAHQPASKHLLFAWDGGYKNADLSLFLEKGFEKSNDVVLTASSVACPPHPNLEFTVRELTTDGEWASATEVQVLCRDAMFSEASYRIYKIQQMADRRRMTQMGIGKWIGAFVGERCVADMGIFWNQDIARYQQVGTHPDYRNKGLCKHLLYAASQLALQRRVKKLVIYADNDYHAIRIYKAAGFKETEYPASVSWHEALANRT